MTKLIACGIMLITLAVGMGECPGKESAACVAPPMDETFDTANVMLQAHTKEQHKHREWSAALNAKGTDGDQDTLKELKEFESATLTTKIQEPPNITLDRLGRAARDGGVSPRMAEHNEALLTSSMLKALNGGVNYEDVGCTGFKGPCHQGDMQFESEGKFSLYQQKITQSNGKRVSAGDPWTDGAVKYCYASDVPQSVREIVEHATQQYVRAVPGLSFEDVGNPGGHSSAPAENTEKECASFPAIFVQSDATAGCWSFTGMLDHNPIRWNPGDGTITLKTQLLNLKEGGCSTLGIAMHELGHAMGMAHEHSRPDRDDYVTIHWENIDADKQNNFVVDGDAGTSIQYDYLSLMHYATDDFSSSDDPTITTAGGRHDEEIGQRVGLSQSDADQIAEMYGLSANSIDASMGCKDEEEFCAGITACDSYETKENCCRCGGGTNYQCWEGSDCEVHDLLPITDHSLCAPDKTSWFGGYGNPYDCVTHNTCDYTITAVYLSYRTEGDRTIKTTHTLTMPPGGCCSLVPAGWENVCQDPGSLTWNKK